MSIIHFKYNAGDYVKFKAKFSSPTCGLVGREGATVKIAGRALAYNNKPHYYLEGEEAVFPETCFAGLAEEPELDLWGCEDLVEGLEQYPEPKFDTEPSVTSEDTAEWEFHEDELFYTCSNCGCSALNDCFGQSTDSKFCPHCGKRMINSTMEADE